MTYYSSPDVWGPLSESMYAALGACTDFGCTPYRLGLLLGCNPNMAYKWVSGERRMGQRYAVRLARLYQIAKEKGERFMLTVHHINWGADGSYGLVKHPSLREQEEGPRLPRPVREGASNGHSSSLGAFSRMEFKQ